jgi:hypothetical protein
VTGSCPVCGDAIGEDPRVCPRCETLHHQECWKYVPGCAVFGCADAAPLAIEDWPHTHQLLLVRTRWVTAAARSLQGVVLCFVALITWNSLATTDPPGLFFAAFAIFSVSTVLAMLGASSYGCRIAVDGGDRLLQLTEAQGDRRLARAVEARTGRLLPLPPIPTAALVTAFVFAPLLVRLGPFQDVSGPLVAAGLLYIILWGALAIPAAWVGRQRVLANRLRSRLDADIPEKERIPP